MVLFGTCAAPTAERCDVTVLGRCFMAACHAAAAAVLLPVITDNPCRSSKTGSLVSPVTQKPVTNSICVHIRPNPSLCSRHIVTLARRKVTAAGNKTCRRLAASATSQWQPPMGQHPQALGVAHADSARLRQMLVGTRWRFRGWVGEWEPQRCRIDRSNSPPRTPPPHNLRPVC